MEQAVRPDALESIRRQRADLHADLVRLEEAAAAAMRGRAAGWSLRVHDALVDMAASFEHHIAVTEGPEGLFDDVQRAAPRLSNALEELRADHGRIRSELSDQLVAVRELARSGSEEDAAALRNAVGDLLADLGRHRQRGSDLVYEAYAVDLGAGD